MTAAVPRHLAIVMDGNRRWARRRHLPAIAGHRAGVDTIRRTLRAARERGVEYLTLYSFSTENWTRDEEEVGALMSLLEETIRRETKTLVEDGVRLMVIGRLHELSDRLQKAILGSDLGLTPGNDGAVIRLNIPALNEERRRDLVKLLHKKLEDGRVEIRTLRRHAHDELRAKEKSAGVTTDEVKRLEAQLQKLTDRYILLADELGQAKEKEILSV